MRAFVILPTYNECENISLLIDEIFKNCPDCQVLVVDDNSPDGTWRVVEGKIKNNPAIHLLRRTKERGRGTAGIAGYQYALQHDADVICEMDADFSHHPKFLPHFLREIVNYDLVSGSRFIQGGDDSDRGWARRLITYFANVYIRTLLGLKLRDCSSGYRCFRREVLRNMNLDSIASKGPSIVQETLLRAAQMGYRILEIPITFVDRKKGKTKLTYRSLVNGFLMVLRLRLTRPMPKINNQDSRR